MNHRSMLLCVTIALMVATTQFGLAQNRLVDKHFSILGQMGIGWDGRNEWSFSVAGPNGRFAPLSKGFSFGAGVEYGPLVQTHGALLMSSFEMAYGQESATLGLANGSVEGSVKRMPVMVWMKLISEGDLSPFIRLGIGAANTKFKEVSSVQPGPNFDFSKWHFSWGAGTGLNYQVNPQVALELFFETWGSEAKIENTNANGVTNGIGGRFVLMTFGARGIVSL